jgi:amino acid adenylation domain-containing protein
MQIRQLLEDLKDLGVSLVVEHDRLVLQANGKDLTDEKIAAVRENPEIINFIKENKPQLIEYIRRSNEYAIGQRSENIAAMYRLSSLQEGMLFHGLYGQESEAYVEQLGCTIKGLDEDAFRSSWHGILQRHTILRSGFYYDVFRIPVQCVYRDVDVPIEIVDLQGMGTADQQRIAGEYAASQRRRGFDFRETPLMRIGLLRLDAGQYRMIWTFHHILLDGWSMPVLMQELLEAYEGILSGRPVDVMEEDRYEEYIRHMEQRDRESEERYWKSYLTGIGEGVLLPFVNGAARERNKGIGEYKYETLRIGAPQTAEVVAFAQRHRLTVNTVMQGVWACLLWRYTGRNDIVFGVTVSGRPEDLPGVEKKVGLFINALPLRTDMEEREGAVDWLRSIQEAQVESRAFQHTALPDIQRWLGLAGDLFDSLLVFENYPVSKVLSGRRWKMEITDIQMHEQVNYPLALSITAGEEINIRFRYNAHLLDTVYVSEMKSHFAAVLEQLTDQGLRCIGDIRLMTADEIGEVLQWSRGSRADRPGDSTIVDRIVEQAARTPDAVAVVTEDGELTFRDLEDRSNRLGSWLRSRGVGREMLVGLCLERSIEMIVGILGIWKAGGAYVPLDPGYPQERLAFLLADTGAKLVLSSVAYMSGRDLPPDSQWVALDGSLQQWEDLPSCRPAGVLSGRDLAYVIYTSGSTGQPKGVMIEHHSLINYLLNSQCGYDATTGDGTAAGAGSFVHLSYTFDASLTAMFMPLLSGRSVVVSQAAAAEAFADPLFRKYAPYDFIKLTPGHMTLLETVGNEEGQETSGKWVVGGEALQMRHFLHWMNKQKTIEIVNEYGPTEATVGCSVYRVNTAKELKEGPHGLPIGKPIDNVVMYILDGQGALTPVGVPGEIYIGGIGVARGYLNRPELTAEKFLADPFDPPDPERMYRTGDQGRWLADGNIEYLGRLDDQVKVRGYRVEPGEIEGVLQQSGQVKQAVVLAPAEAGGHRRLVGYIVPADGYHRETLLTYLSRQLPDYLIPAQWIELERLPLTAHGKVDRKALSVQGTGASSGQTYTAPRTAMEAALATIWEELLGVDSISINDNFFERGGHSLIAVRAISAIRKQMDIEVSIAEIFDYPTIGSLCVFIATRSGRNTLPPVVPRIRPDRIPLSFSQERLWILDQMDGTTQYHIPVVLRMRGALDPAAVEYALKSIVNRHEILRTVIGQEEGRPFQVVLEKDSWALSVADTPGFREDVAALRTRIGELIARPFDLSTDHKLRADLLKLGETEHVLVVSLHHIASDGWSGKILLEEFNEFYGAYTDKYPPQLLPLTIQYADYAIWQRENLRDDLLAGHTAYWQTTLQNTSPLLLPTDYNRPILNSGRGASEYFSLDKWLTEDLMALSRQEGVTLFMILLAAFKVLLYRYTGRKDICVGTPITGRHQQELGSLIGIFINTLALRTKFDGEPSFRDLLQQIRKGTVGAYEHQELPFEKVVEAVVKERYTNKNPLFQVFFEFQNDVNGSSSGNRMSRDLEIMPEPYLQSAAKFDIALSVARNSSGFGGQIEYSTDLYKPETIRTMATHYVCLLRSIAEDPLQRLDDLQLSVSGRLPDLLTAANSKVLDAGKLFDLEWIN